MIDVVEQTLLALAFEPLVCDMAVDDRIVLLFDKTVVVLAVGPRTRKGEPLALAVAAGADGGL